MANILPASVKAAMAASGGAAPVSLLEVQSISGTVYYWSDASPSASIVLAYGTVGSGDSGGATGDAEVGNAEPRDVFSADFSPWIIQPPSFHTYKSSQTATGTVTIQNVSGDSIRRDTSQIFTKQEMMGGLVSYRLWREDCQYALYSFLGTVDDVDINVDGDTMTLSMEGFVNWSKITAPDQQIGVSCPLQFGSVACGSTSATPCNNSYGTCSSIERYKGIVLEWNGAALDYTQYAQPAPLRSYNGRTAN